jgi:hypothetical protein
MAAENSQHSLFPDFRLPGFSLRPAGAFRHMMIEPNQYINGRQGIEPEASLPELHQTIAEDL